MRSRVRITLSFIFLLLLPCFVVSQEIEPVAVLEYFTDESEIEIIDSEGNPFEEIYYGMELSMGDTVRTGATVAELCLEPNRSIIKLGPQTDFTIETLQGPDSDVNAFTLLSGRIRAIAAKGTGAQNYSVLTPSAVCGVRGTDFGQETIPGSRDAAVCFKGEIEFININTGEKLNLGPGMAADVFAPEFRPIQLSQEQLNQLLEEMKFERLDPSAVPGYQPIAEEEPEEEIAETPPEVPEIPEAEEPEEEEKPEEVKPREPGPLDKFFDFLGKYIGMEMGSITVDGETYARAVLQPHLSIGKFRLALYLPAIYQSNLFAPSEWYHPRGNNEWSFGTDQEGTLNILKDILTDLALKIRYIEWGERRDRFFFKIGNLNNLTVGHGILMYKYANDHDFPAIRRIGFNLGLDLNSAGFEVVANDLAEPEIFGGRVYVRPAYKAIPFAFGLSSILDIDPAGEIAVESGDPEPEQYGDPIFVNGAFDLDFPFVNTDIFSLIFFGDIGAMIPYFRESYSDFINQGFNFNVLYKPGGTTFNFNDLSNYGASTGFLGHLAIMDWRLEYRYYNGTFRPAFFNRNYDRIRGQYVLDLIDYLENPDAPEYQKKTMGVYGEAGFNFADKFKFEAGYFWPWNIEGGKIVPSDEDILNLGLTLMPKVIPVVGIHGSLSYNRTKFVPTLIAGKEKNLTLFDANTVLKGEVVFPVAPTMDIAVLVITSTAHDERGNVIKSEKNPALPQVNPSVSFETRIHF